MSATTDTDLFYGEVAVPVPVHTTFTYHIPDELKESAKIGCRVEVPFRNREITGYLVKTYSHAKKPRTKDLAKVLDTEPVLTPELLELTFRISEYYGSSWGEAIENAIPKWVRFGKKAEKTLAKEAKKETVQTNPAITEKELKLSEEQQTAFNQIKNSFENSSPKPILIHGVTGSGKSELYIRAIKEVRKEGKAAICLVPEITLTEQLKLFFSHQFGDELEILHSKLTDRERFLAWNRIETGKKQVILGPRSAVFAPVRNLGLIIMDEEHEGSYKQDTTPRYHARETAAWRAESENALFVMGSATPSLEASRRAKESVYELITLTKRIDDKPLPDVQLIDLKDCLTAKQKSIILSRKLASEIEANIARREGTMLLLNRRGFSTFITCPHCGHIESCESCQVSLTFHHEKNILLCHYCNYQTGILTKCDGCGQETLRFSGFGTEKVESEVARQFPHARIGRLDADTVKKRGAHEEILKNFRDKKIDILIGTQMIAKGFDFPHVTLVGVILADVGLMLPDFRSSERTFQLLTQVAGRAGRGNKLGKVIIQTFSPKHPSVLHAKTHDYTEFYSFEANERYQYGYPPIKQLTNIIVRSKDEKKSYVFTKEARDKLFDLKEKYDLEIIGPAPCPFYKLRGHFRWHVMIKAPKNSVDLTGEVVTLLQKIKKPSAVAFAIDVDPMQIL